ncbi:MAG: M48 family metalloprotease [bacterium]|nr:M48 family metalloprotease [bacterium]
MYDQIASNKRKSVLLIFLFVVVLLILGTAFGLYIEDVYTGLVFAAVISLFMTTIGYFKGDSIALAVAGAKKIERRDNEMLYRLVENLAISEGMKTPDIYLIDDPSPNAFAAGRKPEQSVIAVTTGMMSIMEKVELEGVLAHELGHIKNYDIRVMTLVVVLVGTIVLLSDMFTRSMFFGGRNRDNKSGGGAILIIGLVLAILSPLVAQLIKMAVSRQREYLADATAAMTTRHPDGLARALEKIAAVDKPLRRANHATAHMFIANPFDPKVTKKKFESLFSTHPPIEDRIKRLRGMSA